MYKRQHQIRVGVGVVGQIGQPAVDVADHADAKCHARNQQKAQKREQDYGCLLYTSRCAKLVEACRVGQHTDYDRLVLEIETNGSIAPRDAVVQACLLYTSRPPEPYKGKGIHYVGEHIRRKLGKAAK